MINRGGNADDPIIDVAIEIQDWLQGRLPTTDNAPWFGLAGGVIFAAAGLWAFRRRGDDDTTADVVTHS